MKSRGMRLSIVAAFIFAVVNIVSAEETVNIWDADTGTAGAQDGSGIWSASLSNTNWWSNNDSVNTNWNNSVLPTNTIIGAGSGAAGTITLGEDITVGNLSFEAPGSGSYVLEGDGHFLNFGIVNPLLWISRDVTVTNRISSSNNTRDLNITGGGTIVFEGDNVFHSVDVMDANTAWYGVPGGVSGSTITIPAGASLRTTGYPPIWEYSTFGFRLRDGVTLNVYGTLITSFRIGDHSGEDIGAINIYPGASVTNSADILLGWNSSSTLNMNGGYLKTSGILHQDGSTGSANLNGGTIETSRIYSNTGSGAFNINFNGTLLKVTNGIFFNEESGKNYVSSYFVKDGGAYIDSNGNNIEAIVEFKRGGSGGLIKQGAGTMSFSGCSYTGATTVAEGTLNLNFNKRASWVARNAACDFYDRTSPLVLDGGNFTVTGMAPAPSVIKTFTHHNNNAYKRCLYNGNTSGLVAGMTVSGTYIPADTFVTYINSSSKLLMNKSSNNTVTETESITFGGVTNTTWQTIDNIELQQSATITVDASGGPGTVLSVGAISGSGDLTKAGDGTLALAGINTYSGNTIIQEGTVKLVAPTVVTNHSFEVHNPLNYHDPYGYFDNPGTSANWSFESAGIAQYGDGNTWVGDSAIVDGNDVAFIQANSLAGRVSTTIVTPDDGLYAISFLGGSRPNANGACDLWVEIDGIEQFLFARSEFSVQGAMYSVAVDLAGGSHELAFKGVLSGVDRSVWIDRVSVASLSDGGDQAGSLPSGTEVTLASGSVLDLGGNTQSLAGVSGEGLITNGTLTVSGTVAPGGTSVIGNLTFVTSTTLEGTLLVDVTSEGSCDQLKVEGALDLTGTSLQIQDLNELNSTEPYVVITFSPGELTGVFESTSIDGDDSWHPVYDNIEGEIRLERRAGTIIIIM